MIHSQCITFLHGVPHPNGNKRFVRPLHACTIQAAACCFRLSGAVRWGCRDGSADGGDARLAITLNDGYVLYLPNVSTSLAICYPETSTRSVYAPGYKVE